MAYVNLVAVLFCIAAFLNNVVHAGKAYLESKKILFVTHSAACLFWLVMVIYGAFYNN